MTMPEEKPSPGHNGNGIELIDLAKTLNFRVRELGPEHPDTLQSRHKMAVGFYNLGRVQDAVWLNENIKFDTVIALAETSVLDNRDVAALEDQLRSVVRSA